MLLRENFKLLITNPIVKCMDANISPLVISTLQTYRGNDFFWNRNTEKNKKDFEFIFNTKEIFKDKFIKSITNGKRVVLTANSKKVLKIAKTICDENDIKNLLIFSETPENIKNNITSEILEEVQVFMFSPTITCGVDIQVPFDEVFCYFNNNCNDVNSCIQMTNRVRNINNKKMEIFLDLNHSKENENIDLMMRNRIHLFKNMEAYRQTMSCELDENFNIDYDKNSDWYKLIKNILMNRAKSHNNFMIFFMGLLLQMGGVLIDEVVRRKGRNEDWIKGEDILNDNEAKIYDETELITEYYYRELKDQEDKTPEEYEQIKKYIIDDVFIYRADKKIFPKLEINLDVHSLLKDKTLQNKFKNLYKKDKDFVLNGDVSACDMKEKCSNYKWVFGII